MQKKLTPYILSVLVPLSSVNVLAGTSPVNNSKSNQGRNFICSYNSNLSTSGNGFVLKDCTPIEISTDSTTNLNNLFYEVTKGKLTYKIEGNLNGLEQILKFFGSDSTLTPKEKADRSYWTQRKRTTEKNPSDSISVGKLNTAVQDGIINPLELEGVKSGEYTLRITNSNLTELVLAMIYLSANPKTTVAKPTDSILIDSTPKTSYISNSFFQDGKVTGFPHPNKNLSPPSLAKQAKITKTNEKEGSAYNLGLNIDWDGSEVGAGMHYTLDLGKKLSLTSKFSAIIGPSEYLTSTNITESGRTLVGPGTYEVAETIKTKNSREKDFLRVGLELYRNVARGLNGGAYTELNFSLREITGCETTTSYIERNNEIIRGPKTIRGDLPTSREYNTNFGIGGTMKYNLSPRISVQVDYGLKKNKKTARIGANFGVF